MLGGYACQDTGDARQAQRLAQAAGKGAAVVAAGHAAHAGDPAMVARCHARLCALPERDKHDPGHDPAACRAGRHDEQALKRVWHYAARFGSPELLGQGT
jgi:hypothetical protein